MEKPEVSVPTLPCMCANFRRASRALTQLYDEALRPTGLRATQFTILQALERTGEVSQGKLGRILAIDSTTLTRTLDIMARHGWIAKQEGSDRRERRIRLAKAGETQLSRGLARWEKVQKQIRNKLGDESWKGLLRLTSEVTTIATQ